MNCTNCGKELIEGAKFCLECGTKVVIPIENPVLTCSGCGKELVAGAKFCLECGAKVDAHNDNMVLVCGNCGAIPREGKKFCSKCGADVSVTGVMKPRKKTNKTEQPPAASTPKPVLNQPLQATESQKTEGVFTTEYSCIYDNKKIRFERNYLKAVLYIGKDVIKSDALKHFLGNELSFKPICILETNYQFSTGEKTIKVFAKQGFFDTKYKICIDDEYICGDMF